MHSLSEEIKGKLKTNKKIKIETKVNNTNEWLRIHKKGAVPQYNVVIRKKVYPRKCLARIRKMEENII